MNTNIFKFAICFVSFLGLVACKKDGDMTFSTDPLSVDKYANQEWDITAKSFGVLSSEGDTLDNAEWSSSDEFVVVIDQNGHATAKHVGEAKLYAKFENGMVLYSKAYIHGRSNLFNEPFTGLDMAAVKTSEKSAGKTLVRGGGDNDNYLVYRETSDQYSKNTNYLIYIFGEENGQLLNVYSLDDKGADISARTYRELTGIFLPERYAPNGDSTIYTHPKGVTVYPISEPLKNVAVYTLTENGSTPDKLIASYRASSKAYFELNADTASYKKDVLKLKADFCFQRGGTMYYDANDIKDIVDPTISLIEQGNSITAIEDSMIAKIEDITNVYLAAARISALDICHDNLSQPMAVENYYTAAWDTIAELDNAANADFEAALTFKALDDSLALHTGTYKRVLTKKKADEEITKFNTSFEKSYKEEMYTPENWTEVNRIHDEAVEGIKACTLTTQVNGVKNKANAALKKVPKKK